MLYSQKKTILRPTFLSMATPAAPAATPSVVGYCRVSTDMQARDGVSLDTQRQKIAAWAQYHERPVRGLFVDEGVSGKSKTERPQLLAALAALQREDTFVVYDLSRFARNAGDSILMLQEIHGKGADFCSIQQKVDTTTPQGKMMFTMLSGFNEMEREQTAMKVKDNLQRLSRQGLLGKKAPFGYRWVAKKAPFEAVPEQQAVIEKARQHYSNDAAMSVYKLVELLNEDDAARAAFGGKRFMYKPVRQWLTDNDIVSEHGQWTKRTGLNQLPPPAPRPP